MGVRTVQLAAILIAAQFIDVAAAPPQRHHPRATHANGRGAHEKTPPPLPCGDLLSFQVLLDRQNVSPGEIDGNGGNNFKHAVAAFQQARHLPMTGEADCGTWKAVGGGSTPATTMYTIAEEDVRGPFEKNIPKELVAQASLPALSYRSPLEKLGEKFHVAPALLQKMNATSHFSAGDTIQVPAVQPFDVDGAKPAVDAAAADITIQVTRDESSVRATHADGKLAFYAPVTTGSEHDPLPSGDWKATSVDWHPVFHYNPNLFWDAKPGDTKATIKSGPNNPVGVVWIALSLEHYGLHGTPEPGNIGHTESHGCVRMTNWDAARLASLVKPGTPVLFR